MQAVDPIEKYKKTFYQECEELLTELDSLLPLLAVAGTGGSEALNGAFRVLHTVKGGAGMFRLNRIAGLAHEFESALEIMRRKQQVITQNNILQFLRTSDVLQDLLHAERSGEGLSDAIDADAAEQLHLMVGTLSTEKTSPPPILAGDHNPRTSEPNGMPTTYRISFRPNPRMLRNGNEPLLIFRQLEEYGQVSIVADVSRLPIFEEVDPTTAYLAWTIELKTDAGLEAIRQTFEFVEGDCELEISNSPADLDGITPAAKPALNAPLATQLSPDNETSKTINSAIRESRRVSSIRVELERIDKLVNMVGEIAIVQAMITQQTGQEFMAAYPQLVQDIGRLFQLTQSLQDSVMAIRAVPIGSIFGRIPRLVRELATETGKKVHLETSGEETEIDKTVIEELGDPLLHIIRNSIGHGIESPAEREAAGKRPEGVIKLKAYQRGGQIQIEISDDGRGISLEKVKRKALDLNLIQAGTSLADDEALNLIFLPGFSTAEKVSEISGRGVGMDVVRRNIQKLGGRVTIRTEFGRGTLLTITLPLTLAILPGMIVRSGNNFYIIPMANVIECVQLQQSHIKSLPYQGEVLRFGQRYVPLIKLRDVFAISNSTPSSAPLAIVVEDENSIVHAIVVDEIVDQQQVVIKSLRENLDAIQGLAGATILGDGKVALILVLADLLTLHRNRMQQDSMRDDFDTLQLASSKIA